MSKSKVEPGERYTLNNAKSLYRAARKLADEGCYGHASSLLVLASEEAVKTIDIVAEKSGFLGNLSLVDKNSKNRHKERHSTAKILITAVHYMAGDDNEELTNEAMRAALDRFFTQFFGDYSSNNLPPDLLRMREFWDSANEIKNAGFYVDKREGQWRNPQQISKYDYENVEECVRPILASARIARIIIHYSDRLGLKDIWKFDLEEMVTGLVEDLTAQPIETVFVDSRIDAKTALAGIDLAWKGRANTSALTVGFIDSNKLTVEKIIGDIESIDSLITILGAESSLRGLAIDAPLIIKNQSGQRRAEKELSSEYGSRKASCHTSNLNLYPDPDSVCLSEKLQRLGFGHLKKGSIGFQIECYPHPAMIEMFGLPERLLYKKGSVSEKKEGQKTLAKKVQSLRDSKILALVIPDKFDAYFDHSYIEKLKGKSLKQNEDILDSIICLYTAGLFSIGVSSTVYGDLDYGYIYVPQIQCI